MAEDHSQALFFSYCPVETCSEKASPVSRRMPSEIKTQEDVGMFMKYLQANSRVSHGDMSKASRPSDT